MIGHPMPEPLRRREPPSGKPLPVATQAETMSYIKDLLGSLLSMAECEQHSRLAELLAMAQKEAENISRRLASARG
jgi:hypothetical protein